jgi:hypothetical protein
VHEFVVSGEVPYDVPPLPGAEEQLLLRYAASLLVAATYADAGLDALGSDNVFGRHLHVLLRDAETLAPGRVHLVVLDPEAAAVAERDRARAKTGYTRSVTPDLLVGAVRGETTRRGLWVDNGAETLEETVAAVLARLDDALISPVGGPAPDSAGAHPAETIAG